MCRESSTKQPTYYHWIRESSMQQYTYTVNYEQGIINAKIYTVYTKKNNNNKNVKKEKKVCQYLKLREWSTFIA